MKKLTTLLLCGLGLLASAQASNITLGSAVALNGTFFTGNGGWSLGTNALPSDLVNGTFQPTAQQWNFNSVWWNGNDGPTNNIVVTLPGTFNITDFTVQADDNDTYELDYLGSDLLWHDAWDIPTFGNFGLQTRSVTLGSPITTNALRFTATGGDGLYAVSQIQANGSSLLVPESAFTLSLIAGALGLLALAGRRRRAV